MLATRRELEKLAAGRRDVSLLRGWRKEVVGEKLASGALTCGARAAPSALRRARGLADHSRVFRQPSSAAAPALGGLGLARGATLRARALGARLRHGRRLAARFLRATPVARPAWHRQHVEQTLRDFFQRAFGAHGAQQPRVRVVRQHGLRLVGVDAQALGDRRFFVVLALEQLVLVLPGTQSVAGLGGGAVWMLKTLLHSEQVRRPEMRRTSSASPTSNSTTASSGVPRSFMSLVSASACVCVRGNPSRMNPFCASGCATRSRMMSSIVASSTSRPFAMMASARLPSSVPSLRCLRRMSPVEICGIPNCLTRRWACVPLPDPGAPMRTMRMLNS